MWPQILRLARSHIPPTPNTFARCTGSGKCLYRCFTINAGDSLDLAHKHGDAQALAFALSLEELPGARRRITPRPEMLGEAVGGVAGAQKHRVLAELLAQAIYRLVDPGKFFNFERVLEEFELPHRVFCEAEQHDPRGAVVLARVEELGEGRLNGMEDVMGEGCGPRE